MFTLNACRNWLALSLPRTGRFEAVIGGRLDPKIKATWGKQLTKSKLLPDHFLRKEVIQPQVPLRLPCYDLVPIREFILGTCLSEELAQ